jgi:hypothetical protein
MPTSNTCQFVSPAEQSRKDLGRAHRQRKPNRQRGYEKVGVAAHGITCTGKLNCQKPKTTALSHLLNSAANTWAAPINSMGRRHNSYWQIAMQLVPPTCIANNPNHCAASPAEQRRKHLGHAHWEREPDCQRKHEQVGIAARSFTVAG